MHLYIYTNTRAHIHALNAIRTLIQRPTGEKTYIRPTNIPKHRSKHA